MTESTPPNDLTRVIAKIRKLFALAKSANQHEADAALTAAMQLMDTHRLSMDAVEGAHAAGQSADVEPIAIDPVPVLADAASHPHWKKQLFASLCAHNGCQAMRERNAVDEVKGKLMWRARFVSIGRESDRMMVRFMYEFCERSIKQLTKRNAARLTSKRERDAYQWGCIVGIVRTLEEARRRADNLRYHTRAPGSAGSALAIIDRRLVAVKDWLATSPVKVKEQTAHKRGPHVGAMDHSALMMGVAHGREIRMPSVPVNAPAKTAEIPSETI